jgi:hypothetical protein
MLMNLAAADPIGQARLAAFVQGLQAAGWADGRNVRIDTRWTGAFALSFTNTRQNWSPSGLTLYWPRLPKQ